MLFCLVLLRGFLNLVILYSRKMTSTMGFDYNQVNDRCQNFDYLRSVPKLNGAIMTDICQFRKGGRV